MRRLSGLLAVLLIATGCMSSPAAEPPPPAEISDPPASPATGEGSSYVALGDSYTAGPLIPTTDLAEGCLRSDGNYPSLVASALDLRLTDVSCSGATTADLSGRQQTVPDTRVPAQLDAVDADTDLVTLGIGGNDGGLFSSLVRSCLDLARQDRQGSPCADSDLGAEMVGQLETTGDNVVAAIEAVREKAPEATVVLVGYLRIAPATGACPKRLPFATGDVTFGDEVIRRLNGELRDAADETGVRYVDMYAASEGHDVCGTKPWVNGATTVAGVALAFHPLALGMRAVARELEPHLDSSAN